MFKRIAALMHGITGKYGDVTGTHVTVKSSQITDNWTVYSTAFSDSC